MQINILALTLLRDKEAVSEFQIFSQNTITFNSIRTLPEVLFNTFCMLKIFATQATAKSFVVWVHQLMKFQCWWRVETLWTIIGDIRLYTFMSPKMFLKVIFATELLLTNVTRELGLCGYTRTRGLPVPVPVPAGTGSHITGTGRVRVVDHGYG